jgi:hypothetical protein
MTAPVRNPRQAAIIVRHRGGCLKADNSLTKQPKVGVAQAKIVDRRRKMAYVGDQTCRPRLSPVQATFAATFALTVVASWSFR